GSRPVADVTTVPLLRRVVESLATMRPGRYTVYLGRPDPAAVRAEWDQEVTLLRSARRAVVTTPDTTPLPQEADRRDPGLGLPAPCPATTCAGRWAATRMGSVDQPRTSR